MNDSIPPTENVETIVSEIRRQFIRITTIVGMIIGVGWPLCIFIFKFGNPAIIVNAALFLSSLTLYGFATKRKYQKFTYWSFVIQIFIMILIINFWPNLSVQVHDYSTLAVFPILALFLLNKKRGIAMIVFYLLAIVAILALLPEFALTKYGLMFDLIATIITTTALIYFYQYTTDKAQSLVKKREEEREQFVQQLVKEVHTRQETQSELKQKITEAEDRRKELETLNNLMVGRELAMVALKEKIKKMEEQYGVSPS